MPAVSSNAGGGGSRPRLNLSRRTAPEPAKQPAAPPAEAVEKSPVRSAAPKSNPFGSAKAVDTASRFAAIELKEKEEKEKKEEEKAAAAAKKAEEEAAKAKGQPPVVSRWTRGAPVGGAPKEEEKEETVEKAAEETTEGETKEDKGDKKDGEKRERRERKQIEPKVVNSRAAMLGDAAAPKKEELGDRRDRDRRDRGPRDNRDSDRGPPPVVNERFAKLADEEKEKNMDRDFRRRGGDDDHGPPQPVSSRFAAAAEMDRSAPRGGDFRDGRDRDMMDRGRVDDAGPPPPTNSRWGGEHRDNRDRDIMDRGGRGGDRDRDRDAGPPLQPTNSRFAAAAADYETERGNRDRERAERGPPPQVTNSRFAAAAANHERENDMRDRDRADRGGGDSRFDRRRDDDDRGGGNRFGRGDERGGFGRNDGPPPMVQNSRFAAAVQGDEDYVPAEVRNQRNNERNEQEGGGRFGQQDGGSRFDRQDGDGRGFGGGGGGYNDRGGGGGRFGNNRGRGGDHMEIPTGPRSQQYDAPADNYPPLNKGKVANILAPKKRDADMVMAPVEAPLTLPGEDEAAARARLEKKRLEDEAKAAAEQKAAEEAAAAKAAAEKEAAESAAKAAALESKLLDEFASGNKLGEDLQQWCSDQGSVLPTVEKLIFHLLSTKEQKNPDPNCAWAEADNYGAALVPLVEDDADAQMQVLWALQKYCETIGFPKINDEYVVQAMFRSMYRCDLAEPGAFDLWKEDESEENSRGKMKAVIQTMDWFTWLEEDDDSEEEEEEEEEE